MRKAVVLAVSLLAAASVLTVGLAAAGFAPPPRASSAGNLDVISDEGANVAQAKATLEPEVVYVKPAPKPKTVVVKRQVRRATTARSSRSTSASRSTTVRRASREREDDDRRERASERRKEAAEDRRERERHEDDD
jgi:hypothetical protein